MKRFLSGIGLLLGAAALVISLNACGVDPGDRPLTLDFKQENAFGCANIFIYVKNSTKREWLIIQADREKIPLSRTPKTFDLASAPDGLNIFIDTYAKAPGSLQYCNDIFAVEPIIDVWRAKSGTVTITVSEDAPQFNIPYEATVLLKNVRFENDRGKSVVLEERLLKAGVGIFPG